MLGIAWGEQLQRDIMPERVAMQRFSRGDPGVEVAFRVGDQLLCHSREADRDACPRDLIALEAPDRAQQVAHRRITLAGSGYALILEHAAAHAHAGIRPVPSIGVDDEGIAPSPSIGAARHGGVDLALQRGREREQALTPSGSGRAKEIDSGGDVGCQNAELNADYIV